MAPGANLVLPASVRAVHAASDAADRSVVHRVSRSRGVPLAGVAGFLLFLGLAAPHAAEREVHVRGRIVDPGGAGVGETPVRLFKTRRSMSIGKFSSGGQIAEAAKTVTDENGFFEIRIPRDRTYDDYFLRFNEPGTFDAVRFVPPEDREITRDLRHGTSVIVDIVLQFQPDWEEVQRRISLAGEGSSQARILRTLGIPERELSGKGPEGPREEWWYHSRGVVYFFRDGVSLGYKRFEPVTVPAGDGGV